MNKYYKSHHQDFDGEIIDYYNVFRNMKKALKDYGLSDEGTDKAPVHSL